MPRYLLLTLIATMFLLAGCAKINFLGPPDPLREVPIRGEGEGKVLVLPIRGTISETPSREMMRIKPSTVQMVVERLRKAEADPEVKALLLVINSPGGTSSGSDVVYHEISRYSRRTGVPVTALLMGVAASGGYYAALAAQRVVALPTTVTGSVGVIFIRPKVHELFHKIGVSVEVSKSGQDKDMLSPFREDTGREKELIQGITNSMAKRFLDLVRERRGLDQGAMARVSTARIFTSAEALSLGLVDSVGYMDDALAEARELGGLAPDARVVTYRRTEYPDDTEYNFNAASPGLPPLVNVGLDSLLPVSRTGFYYLWLPGGE